MLYLLDKYLVLEKSGDLFIGIAKTMLFLCALASFAPSLAGFMTIKELDFDVSGYMYLVEILMIYFGINLFMLMIKRTDQCSLSQSHEHVVMKLFGHLLKSIIEFIGVAFLSFGIVGFIMYLCLEIFDEDTIFTSIPFLFGLYAAPTGIIVIIIGKYLGERISILADIHHALKK